MATVTVREAITDDAPTVQRIAHEGWRAAYGDFLSESVLEYVRNEWHTVESFHESAIRADTDFFVAEQDGEVVGYASGGIGEDGLGGVWTLYVHPDRWGGGIGTRLFEAVLDALRKRGADRVEIHVLAENDIGIAFYESQEFERVYEGESEFGGATHREYIYASDI